MGKYCLADMQAEFNIDCDEFIILAGSFYYRDLISSLPHYTLPLGQLRMGERISWLNRQNSKLSKNIISHRDSSATYVEPAFYCSELHKILMKCPDILGIRFLKFRLIVAFILFLKLERNITEWIVLSESEHIAHRGGSGKD